MIWQSWYHGSSSMMWWSQLHDLIEPAPWYDGASSMIWWSQLHDMTELIPWSQLHDMMVPALSYDGASSVIWRSWTGSVMRRSWTGSVLGRSWLRPGTELIIWCQLHDTSSVTGRSWLRRTTELAVNCYWLIFMHLKSGPVNKFKHHKQSLKLQNLPHESSLIIHIDSDKNAIT